MMEPQETWITDYDDIGIVTEYRMGTKFASGNEDFSDTTLRPYTSNTETNGSRLDGNGFVYTPTVAHSFPITPSSVPYGINVSQVMGRSFSSFNSSGPNPPRALMECFSEEKVTDLKHVVYNELVKNFNNQGFFAQPCTLVSKDKVDVRQGFRFNEAENPEEKLPEMYACYIKKAKLELEVQAAIFRKDLYKFYLRACLELLSKYFEKVDKFTFLYEVGDEPLFVPNGSLEDAQRRIRRMKTRARKRKPSSEKIILS